jgi:hypothetical protein
VVLSSTRLEVYVLNANNLRSKYNKLLINCMKVVFWVTVSTSALKYGIKHVIRKCRPTLATVKVKCKLFHKYILFFMTSRLQFRNLNAIIKLKCTGWLESSVWSFRPSGRLLWCYQFQRFPVLRILLFVFSRLLRFLWLGKWRHTFGLLTVFQSGFRHHNMVEIGGRTGDGLAAFGFLTGVWFGCVWATTE